VKKTLPDEISTGQRVGTFFTVRLTVQLCPLVNMANVIVTHKEKDVCRDETPRSKQLYINEQNEWDKHANTG